MHKKTLLSLAVASTIGLSGCFSDGSNSNAGASTSPEPTPSEQGTFPLFNPVTQQLPVPNDINFAGTEDGTATTDAFTWLDGASTVAQIDIKLSGTIDPASINATPFVPNPQNASQPIPNPQQNVFLLELDFPGNDPLANDGSHYRDLIDGLVESGEIQDPDLARVPGEIPTFEYGLKYANFAGGGATTANDIFALNQQFRAQVIQLDGGDDNVLRITPLKPLDPKKKYLVVVTDEVQTTDGTINASPAYQRLEKAARNGESLDNPSLDAVAETIVGWEQLATGYFSNLTNTARQNPLSEDNIALAYTFSTGGTTDVLEAAASPAQFFHENAIVQTRQHAIAKYLAQNADDFAQMGPSQQYGTLETVADNAVDAENNDGTTLKQTAAGTAAQLVNNGADFSHPQPRPINLFQSTRIPASQFGLPNADETLVQASISLPYYLDTPTETDPSGLNNPWQASETVGGLIDAAQGNDAGTTPPSEQVTYRFPFPGEQETVNVPLLISAPDPANCTAPYDVVVYQHGIFGNRAHSATLGNQLAENCLVTVAMDLPLHGIGAKTAQGNLNPFLALNVDVTLQDGEYVESPLSSQVSERHFGWAQKDGSPTPMQYSTNAEQAVGYAGQFFLNLKTPAVARDNNRQAIIDLLNLNASLSNLDSKDLDGNGGGTDFSNGNSDVYFVGHSLGSILGGSYLALTNSQEVAQDPVTGNSHITPFTSAALVTPGGGIAKLLENSRSISPTVLQGLAPTGRTQGSLALERFMRIAQASMDSVDPLNFAPMLSDAIGSNAGDLQALYINEVYGDGSTRTTQDDTIPVAADTCYGGDYTAPLGRAFPAPLAGTEPLIQGIGAEAITSTGSIEGSAGVVRFNTGSHSTIVSGEPTSVLTEISTNIVSLFTTSNETVTIAGTGTVRGSGVSPSCQ